MCTGIKLKAQDGTIVHARTLEFAQQLDSAIIVIPRNYSFTGVTPQNQPGLLWQAHYAAVGANAAGIIDLVDGLNEKGLAGGLFYFPDYADYQESTADNAAQTIAPWQLLTYLLTMCATVEEVIQLLPTITVAGAVFEAWGIIPPVHAIVHDSAGNSVVIEYIKGQLVLTANPLGAFTNAPTFDWHVTNLRNYINISALNVPPVALANINLKPLSQGSGMLGLPGDFTSPSRFVRAAVYCQTAVEMPTADEAIHQAFHILNLFDIPYGSVRQQESNNTIAYEYTEWTSASDTKNKRFYISTYQSRALQMVDLPKIQFTNQKPIIIPLQTQEYIIDLTNSATKKA